MPIAPKTFQLFTTIDNPAPALIFSNLSLADSEELENAIRHGDWWVDPANPMTWWHLAGVARYDVSATTSSLAAASSVTKKLTIHTGPITQVFLIPFDQVGAVDEAAQAGGFSTLPSGQRINWDLVTSYSFA